MDIYNNQNILTIEFNYKIDYTITDFYEKITASKNKTAFQFLVLDFSKTKLITLPGAMYILFIVSEIINSKINIETRILHCSESILNVIASFGLINILKFKGNLKIDEFTNELSEAKLRFWKKSVKQTDYNLDALYWPISNIPVKTSDSFQADVSSFINNFTVYFAMLIKYKMIRNLESVNLEFIRKDFIGAINESTKNVWDHSESWGAASIHSNRYNKTTFCLFDYGVGFINSYIKRKGIFERNSKNDIDTLIWLFKEGNTSNEINNHGRGLAKIAKFTNIINGILLIRTDKYLLQYNRKGLEIFEKKYFPGSQLMINF